MSFRFSFISPTGREWRLIHEDPNGVFANEDSLVEGLVGARSDTPVTAVGRSGQRVATRDSQITPIAFSLPCTVDVNYCGGRSADEVWRAFRADWGSCSPETPGTIVLDNDLGAGRLRLPCRLNGPISGPSINPAELEVIPVTVPVIGDGGRWLQSLSGAGQVTVVNAGVDEIYPTVRWGGAGGVVVLPSGASFTLPPVAGPRTLLLDPAESYAVLDRGALDETLWREIRGRVAGESVPEGQARTYTVPAGANLVWNVGHLDPWR